MPAQRLGTRLVKGMPERDARAIAEAVRARGPFESVSSLWRASSCSVRALRALAQADGFRSMGLDRQRALWQVRPLRDDEMPLFAEAGVLDRDADDAHDALLPGIAPDVRVLHDYASVGLSLKAHPMSFLRNELSRHRVVPAADLRSATRFPQGTRVRVAGLVLCRQRPSTASGVTFITLEDETGIANLVVWRDTFERFRRVARLSTILLVNGSIERQGEVIHVHARKLESLDENAPALASVSRDFH